MGETRYGNGGKGHGRRMVDDVSKAKHPEDRKHVGRWAAGGAAFGGAAGAYAGHPLGARGMALSGGANAVFGAAAGGAGKYARNRAARERREDIDRAVRAHVGKAVSVKAALGGVPDRKTALKATGIAAGGGLLAYGVTPQGRKKAREGKVASNLARSNAAYRNLPRAQRKEIAQQLISTYDQAKSGTVGKSRFYDPEHRRQRRLGAAEAGLTGGALAGLALGGRGVVRVSRLARKTQGIVGDSKDVKALRSALKHGVAARRQDAALAAGGAAAGIGAYAVNRHAESRRGRAWN